MTFKTPDLLALEQEFAELNRKLRAEITALLLRVEAIEARLRALETPPQTKGKKP